MTKLAKPAHGHGLLVRGGRKKGARNTVSRTFREVSEAIMNDPDVVAMLKRRVMLELAGRKRNPLPLVAVLGAACSGDKAKERDARGAISFAVQIVAGRGVVERVAPTRSLLQGSVDETEVTPTARVVSDMAEDDGRFTSGSKSG